MFFMNDDTIHVAVAVLVDGQGRVLINQRLPGKEMAGRWEFPGGKLEPGEDAQAALRRELDEELGITPRRLRPLVRIRHDYPQRRVLLDCWRVEDWTGVPRARESQPLEWVAPADLHAYPLLAADRPLLRALTLPSRYAITGAEATPSGLIAGIEGLLESGHALLQLRAPGLDDAQLRIAASGALALCRAHGARLLVNCEPEFARELEVDGVHLSAARLMRYAQRPLGADRLVAASCHDRRELEHAAAIGCDCAMLGPVQPTASHPDATPLGWARFDELADCAGLPVYALGGVGDADIATAWQHHGQGVAAITAWWPA